MHVLYELFITLYRNAIKLRLYNNLQIKFQYTDESEKNKEADLFDVEYFDRKVIFKYFKTF